jgi:hypothetical protein
MTTEFEWGREDWINVLTVPLALIGFAISLPIIAVVGLFIVWVKGPLDGIHSLFKGD